MPNYVMTKLQFDASEKELEAIKNFVKDETNDEIYEFDFRKIVPYPKTLKECPKEFLLDMEYNVSKEWCGTLHQHNSKALIEVIDDYPFLNWYDWQVEKWGTKWNACDPVFEGDTVTFTTAWSFCEPIVVELSKKFPKVTINFKYADEDIGSNCDTGFCKNGNITFNNISVDDKYRVAMEMWDREGDYTLVDGRWEYTGE